MLTTGANVSLLSIQQVWVYPLAINRVSQQSSVPSNKYFTVYIHLHLIGPLSIGLSRIPLFHSSTAHTSHSWLELNSKSSLLSVLMSKFGQRNWVVGTRLFSFPKAMGKSSGLGHNHLKKHSNNGYQYIQHSQQVRLLLDQVRFVPLLIHQFWTTSLVLGRFRC